MPQHVYDTDQEENYHKCMVRGISIMHFKVDTVVA